MKCSAFGIGALGFGLLAGCAKAPMTTPAPTAPTAQESKLSAGIDEQNIDPAVRPQDDFYHYVNGNYLKREQIPADKSRIGSFTQLADGADLALRQIIEAAAKTPNRAPGSEAQKIGDLYASFMDEPRLETLGLKPVQPMLAKIEAVQDKKQLAALMGDLTKLLDTPFSPGIHQDAKDSTKYIVDLGQGGLGLPDRDYYLKDDAKLKEVLAKYRLHLALVFKLAGDANAEAEAESVIKVETSIAQAQWTKVENRDPVKTYNRYELHKLDDLAPGYDWRGFFAGAGLDGKMTYVIVSQPTFITKLNAISAEHPLAAWKAYYRWQALRFYSDYLGKAFVDANFAFFGTVLSGTPENRPRWKRGVTLVEHGIGEGLGKLYVDQFFPPASKARMEALVANLLKAYAQSIDTLDWMTPATKAEARAKLAKFTPKIGYPKMWRDYSTLTLTADDLTGNVTRAYQFEYQRNVNKLGKPIDRDEWGMTPQTVNAYYNPELNEIVFPAAILQPPFFNPSADDAVNYGGIGAVIGHEISHGFDDQGAQYDGDGNLRDWWTKADHEAFAAKTKALVAQYAAQEPVTGFHLNGELTLGENIADNSGLAIAYKAYRLSLNGAEAPVIDTFTGDQRVYMGWSQVWRGKTREAELLKRIKSDPHSPSDVRGWVPLENQPAFFAAFNIQPTDKMYNPPEKRIVIW